MKRFLTSIILIGMTCFCFAPIEHKPEGAKFHSELSDDQMAKIQGDASATFVPATGAQPVIEKQGTEVKQEESKSEGEKAVATVSDPSTAAIRAVTSELEAKKQGSKGPSWMIGLGMLLAGIVGAFAFKVYANKVVPEPHRYVRGKKKG